ncbi:uncharacterized protein BDZ83DRAFT_197443 [Colletotrichum acutatum]|uniref:Uncharacterized protein n=1 Tax=Glomerella acutata TaxID=27357 RepID=A0AAD8URP9_GLOAC|nr:uncharacterized protein BDZ83DRAFT_197443 [Colletotrichum acutatum]KAK1727612.1 hypothetical protein BDZ83DRAFT_197443 [Colletotrichum acutatum]
MPRFQLPEGCRTSETTATRRSVLLLFPWLTSMSAAAGWSSHCRPFLSCRRICLGNCQSKRPLSLPWPRHGWIAVMPQRTTEYRCNTQSDQTGSRREKPVTIQYSVVSTILGPVYPSTPSSHGPGILLARPLTSSNTTSARHSTCRLKLCTPPMSALWPMLPHVEVSTDVQTLPFRARQSYRPTHAIGQWLDPVQLSYERLRTVSPGQAQVSHRGLSHIFVGTVAQPQIILDWSCAGNELLVDHLRCCW